MCDSRIITKDRIPTGYKGYLNDRFGYAVAYPSGFLIPRGESDNSDGQKISSTHQDVVLSVWGSWNTLEESTSDIAQDFKNGEYLPYGTKTRPTVTYSIIRKNWVVMSGTYNGRVIYFKDVLDKYGEYAMTFTYPISMKQKYDPMTVEIAHTLIRYQEPYGWHGK